MVYKKEQYTDPESEEDGCFQTPEIILDTDELRGVVGLLEAIERWELAAPLARIVMMRKIMAEGRDEADEADPKLQAKPFILIGEPARQIYPVAQLVMNHQQESAVHEVAEPLLLTHEDPKVTHKYLVDAYFQEHEAS